MPLGAGQLAIDIGRRQFISALGGAVVARPLAARAQQQPAVPVVRYLDSGSPDGMKSNLAGFHSGLSETGYTESLNRPGGNVTGASRLSTELMPKRPGMLGELVPKATVISFLVTSTTCRRLCK